MGIIKVLDPVTIDKIAAGEVIERPASVIKELVENAIDANATAIVVEIQDGGITYMRVADNGKGIAKEDVANAFLRHSTSKIRSVDDLTDIHSLGFRGEALSSIAAVSQVELLTKTRDHIFGTRYRISGGKEISCEEAGAKDGTTFIIRQLFYNTPARKKFLKTPMTEASHVGDLMSRLALSHPEISFQFINNGQSRLHSSGNGNLKDVIYHIYGRDVASNLLKAEYEIPGLKISGFLGKPVISRGNRNFENYYINGRYVKSNIIARAIEDGYHGFTMQHKYPFVVLQLEIDGDHIDVNVHPTKMELRFNNQQQVYTAVLKAVEEGLHREELISHVEIDLPKAKPVSNKEQFSPVQKQTVTPVQKPAAPPNGEPDLDYFMKKMRERVESYHERNSSAEVESRSGIFKPKQQESRIRESAEYRVKHKNVFEPEPVHKQEQEPPMEDVESSGVQLNFFDEKMLSKESVPEHKIIGQVFDTYWLVEFHDNLYIIDQHAAHEKVLYEKTIQNMRNREYTSQMISPPIILNLSMQEAQLLTTYMDCFTRIGFEIEEFGQGSYKVSAIPDNLFSIAKEDLLMEMIDSLSDELSRDVSPDLIDEKIASMSCKAAVKGNTKLSVQEIHKLIGDLLTLDNPYHCPHGRPTIIAMSKRELEKKFKRIV